MTARPIANVVVGYDGSTTAQTALAWAGRFSSLVRARVHIVHAVGLLEGAAMGGVYDVHRRRALQCAVDAGMSASDVEWAVLNGDPCSVLFRESVSIPADLVVVGFPGGRWAQWTAPRQHDLELVEHSTIPVVVVPAGAEASPRPGVPQE